VRVGAQNVPFFELSSPSPRHDTVTRLLEESRQGRLDSGELLDQLFTPLYEELRRLARRYMRSERGGHTLQTTALVNEAYARLVGSDISWRDRAHFFRAAGQAMRRVLVDHARAAASAKRGGGRARVTLEEAKLGGSQESPDILELDDVLRRLAEHHERQARVVEQHFFVGLSYEETAKVLEISPATVDRDMRFARAWLRDALSEPSSDEL
jgi:RNA polymerase sigma factor (TIGR02999 family)